MQKPYALFDFDGTLIRGDSIVRFVRYAHARGLIGAGGLLRAALWAAAYGLHLTTAERAKRESLSFLAGREQGRALRRWAAPSAGKSCFRGCIPRAWRS